MYPAGAHSDCSGLDATNAIRQPSDSGRHGTVPCLNSMLLIISQKLEQ